MPATTGKDAAGLACVARTVKIQGSVPPAWACQPAEAFAPAPSAQPPSHHCGTASVTDSKKAANLCDLAAFRGLGDRDSNPGWLIQSQLSYH